MNFSTFEVFRQKRSARAIVLNLHEKRIYFPSVLLKGPRKGEIVRGRLLYTRGEWDTNYLSGKNIRDFYRVCIAIISKLVQEDMAIHPSLI